MAKVLITSGPTREPIDPVRFIANASSGRMGQALAEEALRLGHEVTVVAGPQEIPLPQKAQIIPVTTALEMLEATRNLHPQTDILIGAAAVSDYRPKESHQNKRARNDSTWSLEMVANPDILKTLGEFKNEQQLHVGFALETPNTDEEGIERAQSKLQKKNLDWIVLNRASAIGSTHDEFWLISKEGEVLELGELSKTELAAELWKVIPV